MLSLLSVISHSIVLSDLLMVDPLLHFRDLMPLTVFWMFGITLFSIKLLELLKCGFFFFFSCQ